MFLAYGWHLPIIFIKNAEFSFCFYILLFIWWWFGKVEDLYTDAQIASHPWFLSTPYFRCHHTDVSLSLHLLLKKITFRYLVFFLHVFGEMFYFSFVTIWVFFPFLGSVPTPLNSKVNISLKFDDNNVGEVSFVYFTLPHGYILTPSPSNLSSEHQIALHSIYCNVWYLRNSDKL